MPMTWFAVAGAFLFASFIKGTTGMGFPLIATPMLALLLDIHTTYALLILPNMLMDVWQIGRGALPWPLWRQIAPLLVATAVGVVAGTRLMIAVPVSAIYLTLAGAIGLFLVSSRLPQGTIPDRWDVPLGSLAGLVSGLLAGLTNIVGPIGAMYLLARRYRKRDFVKGVASMFLTAKLGQLAALSGWGLYPLRLVPWSALLTGVALGAFWVGLRTQDRVNQEGFGRILRAMLAVMAAFFLYRGISAGLALR
jgi:uncharacterized membrane protein YfcA